MPKSPSTDLVDSPVAVDVADSHSQQSPAPIVTRTPEEWAEVYFPATATGRQHAELWKHASAVQMHGWNAYEARSGKKAQLTAALYESAVTAVSANNFKAHPEADYRSRS